MQLLEFVVQGLRHVPEQRRITLGPALNALLDPSEGAPKARVLAAALRGLMSFDPDSTYANDVADPAAAASRVGLMFRGKDGVTYRLVHDLKSGAVMLHKQKADSSGLEPLSTNVQEVFQFLRSGAGLPPSASVRRVLCASGDELPTVRMSAAAPNPMTAMAMMSGGTAGAMVPGMMPGMMPGMVPGMMPGMMPGMVPGMMPMMMPGMMQMMAGMMPGMMPGGTTPSMPNPVAGAGNTAAAAALAGVAGNQKGFAHLSPEEKRARLEAVNKALNQLKDQAKLEFELDGLSQKKFDLEERLRPLKKVEAAVAEARTALAPFEDVARVPADMLRQLDSYQRQKAALDDEIKKLDESTLAAQERAATSAVAPIWMDRLFQGGMGAGVGALVVGFGFSAAMEMPSLRYLALLDAVGFGAAALSAFRYIDQREDQAELSSEGALIQEKKDKAQRRFDLDTSNVRKILSEHQVKDAESLEAFRERLLARQAGLAKLEAIQKDADQAKAALNAEAGPAEMAAVAARLAEIEGRLQGMGFTGNEKDLLVEQAQLRAELGLGDDFGGPGYESAYPQAGGGGEGGGKKAGGYGDDDDGPAPARWAPGADGGGQARWAAVGAPPPSGGGSGGGMPVNYMMGAMPQMMGGPTDGIVQLTKAAQDLFGVPMDKLGALLQARAAQYLTAFSDRRFSNVSFTDKGDAAAVDAQGKISAYATMPAQDQDLVWLAVLLTLVETHVRNQKFPVVVDHWFSSVPDVKHPLICKMLQYLGSLTQVIHFCGKPSLTDGAEPKVNL